MSTYLEFEDNGVHFELDARGSVPIHDPLLAAFTSRFSEGINSIGISQLGFNETSTMTYSFSLLLNDSRIWTQIIRIYGYQEPDMTVHTDHYFRVSEFVFIRELRSSLIDLARDLEVTRIEVRHN